MVMAAMGMSAELTNIDKAMYCENCTTFEVSGCLVATVSVRRGDTAR